MKILVFSQYYYPEQFRINDICEELVQRGHKITVVTGRPNYPEGEIYVGYETKMNEERNGVKIIRTMCRPRKTGIKNLALNYISYVWQACKEIKRLEKDYDIVFAYQLSPITSVIPAIVYKRKYKKKLCLFCCDIWPESISEFVDKKSSVYKVIGKMSSKIYGEADEIIVRSPSFLEYLSRVNGVPDKKLCYIPEYVEDDYLSVSINPIDNDVIDCFFFGNIGRSQNCEIIIRALQRIDEKAPIKVHFVGDGSKLEDIKKLTSELKQDHRVVFHGRHSLSEMPKYYEMADVCLLTLANESQIGLTLPSKLVGYMAAGRPVVAAIEGDAKDVIDAAGCGICVESNNIGGFADSLCFCLENKEKLKKMGVAGRDYFCKEFNKGLFFERLEKVFMI